MIIVLKAGSTDAEVEDVCGRIERMGYRAHTIRGELRTVIGAIGDDRGKDRLKSLESLECVEAVQPILQPFKLASREVRREATVISVDGVGIGGPGIGGVARARSAEAPHQEVVGPPTNIPRPSPPKPPASHTLSAPPPSHTPT